MNDRASMVLMVLIALAGLIGLVFYFIPSLIAHRREHPHLLAIFVVNLLFGATVVGWVGALVWALVTPRTAGFSVPVRIYDERTASAPARQAVVARGSMARERREPRLTAIINADHAPADLQPGAVMRCELCGQHVAPSATIGVGLH